MTLGVFKSWWFAAVVVAVILFLVLHREPAPEPKYGGLPLSYWFHENEKLPYLFEAAPTTKAIREMGVDAVPYLAAELAREEPLASGWYTRSYRAMPHLFEGLLPTPRRADTHQQTAARMLFAVGLPARAALPALLATYDRAYARHFLLPLRFKPDWAVQFTKPPAALLPGGPMPAPENDLREWILMTLASVGGDDPQVVPLILCAIQEPNPAFRSGLTRWLKGNPNLASAITLAEPTVLLALNDSVPQVRATAADMLGAIAPGHPEVIPPLLKAAADPDLMVRTNALESLSKARPGLGAVLPVIASALTDDNSDVRHFGGLLLFKTAGPGMKAFGPVSNALSNADAGIRAAAARVMGTYGPRAQAAVPKLTELTNAATEPDERVRRAAGEALKKIASGENP